MHAGGMIQIPVDHYAIAAGTKCMAAFPPDTEGGIESDNRNYDAPRDKKRLCAKPYCAKDSIRSLVECAHWWLENPSEFARAMGKGERTWSLRNAVRDMISYDRYLILLAINTLKNYGVIGEPQVGAGAVDDYAGELIAAGGAAGILPSDNLFTTRNDDARTNAVLARDQAFTERLGVMLK